MARSTRGESLAEYPVDADRGVIAGPLQEHILVMGDVAEINRGVLTNTESVAAHLAREHQLATQNGACWLVLAVPENVAANAVSALRRNQDLIAGTDIFVIMLGHTDTIRLTPASQWGKHLRSILAAARETLPKDARVVMPEIPHLGPLAAWGRMSRQERCRRRLNKILRSVTRSDAGVTSTPLPEQANQPAPDPAASSSPFSTLYASWATAIQRAYST